MKKVTKTFLASIISIILFCLMIILALICNLQVFLSKDNLVKATKEVSFISSIEEVSKGIVTPASADIIEKLDKIYEVADEFSIPRTIVNDVIDSDAVKEFIGKSIANTATYVITGENQTILTQEDFNQILDHNIDGIIDASKQKVTEEQKVKLVDAIKSHSNILIGSLPKTEEVTTLTKLPKLDTIQFIFHDSIKIDLVIIIILLHVLLYLLKKDHFKWLKYCAITTFATGIVIMISGSFFIPIVNFIFNDENPIVMAIIRQFIGNLQQALFFTGGCAIILALMEGIFTLVVKDRKKGNKKEMDKTIETEELEDQKEIA